ncbi:MAG: NAD(+) synthase [Crocinitomicaceae bacterium]|nr:NAD(+) synthase [Crocinitomicaceae bacterium]
MNAKKTAEYITNWLKDYAIRANAKGYIIGISGGIDSAVTSLLCAQTGLSTHCLEMAIHQNQAEVNRGLEHIAWLEKKFPNVSHQQINLTESFDTLCGVLPEKTTSHGLSMANTRARLRMLTLYAVGQSKGLLVAGTGNKVEDFGVGFYTKYGDGGVDVSPIADLKKTEVYEIAKAYDIIQSIQSAAPTDGLWKDERTDEGQLGATYPELEWAMDFYLLKPHLLSGELLDSEISAYSVRQKEVLKIYRNFNRANQHKMIPIPVCIIPDFVKE